MQEAGHQVRPARDLHRLERQLVEPPEAFEDLAVETRLPRLERIEGGRAVDHQRAELPGRAHLGQVRGRRRPDEDRAGDGEVTEAAQGHQALLS